MNSIPPRAPHDAKRLGILAAKFRGTRSDEERREIAKDYCQTVERLIQSGVWHEMPAPEEQLPDAWMPKAFFDYWLRPSIP